MKINKIGRLSGTKRTIEKFIPKYCFVDKVTNDMELSEDFPVLLICLNSTEWQVYGKNRNDYWSMINTIKRI